MADVYDPVGAQMSQQSATERLAQYITYLQGLTNLQIWLYSNNVVPAPANTLANFTEVNFGGYARATGIMFGSQGLDVNANAYATSALVTFACSGASPSGTVYGSLLVGTPAGAVAATITAVGGIGGAYGSYTITNPGAKYSAPPKVTPTGASGSGFAATAVLTNGEVTSLLVTNAGTGYSTYTMTLDAPLELIKQNVLSQNGISMALATDLIVTYTQLIEPSNAQ
jgi:hypothetical protein